MRFISHKFSRRISRAGAMPVTIVDEGAIQRKTPVCRLTAGTALLAALAGCAHPDPGPAGQWQLSWQGRIGSEQATVVLQPNGHALSGSFRTPRATAPLSGSVQGSRLSFAVDFPGPPAYRILFSGLAHGDRIEGEALPQDVNGRAFAGHGGEVAREYYTWSATRLAP
jgi:hypothetical protein